MTENEWVVTHTIRTHCGHAVTFARLLQTTGLAPAVLLATLDQCMALGGVVVTDDGYLVPDDGGTPEFWTAYWTYMGKE